MTQSRRRPFKIESKRRSANDAGDAPQVGEAAPGVGQILNAIESLRSEIADLKESGPAAAPPVDADLLRQQIVEAEKMRGDLQELSDAIERTKTEIASLRSTDKSSDKIATASDALRAVVGDTESATDGIMNSAEAVEEIAGRLRAQVSGDEAAGMVDELFEQATMIFEHCNFQDITGQRITKVVNTMEFIDDRVHRMMEIWGGEMAFEGVEADEGDNRSPDGEVLHGPAMDGDTSISQDEIDALFD